jgi:hypothetical protein
MNINGLIYDFALKHKDYFIGIGIGIAISHARIAFDLVFDWFDKFSWFHNFIVEYPTQEEELIDTVADEAKKKIEAAKTEDKK